jgi:hypothetical protein
VRYFSDSMRHLVCWPYTEENLHAMAKALNIKRCWFHATARYKHYDIPKKRIQEIANRTEVVSPRVILKIVRGEAPPDAL